MNNYEEQIKLQLNSLSERVNELILFFKLDLDFNKMVYTLWSAKDVLGHLTFWHESFAKNLQDMANKTKPNPLKGKLSEVNQMSVKTTYSTPVAELIMRLQIAQHIIEQNIGNSSIKSIPYKKESRNYTRLEHLEIVERHIRKHLNDLTKKFTS